MVDFSFRRTHGVEAARAAARSSAIVGFAATSNVEAAQELGLPVAGTMAHSFVMAFDDEREAFRAFAEDHPNRTTFLVDTYDTLEGVRHAIDVIGEMGLDEDLGIRLDSGNLDQLARDARKLLDHAGLGHARIFASGGLDEFEIDELVRGGAPVDAFGVGTQLGVSADAPYVDSVYKLVEYEGRPVLKLSAAKATAPGRKQVWRGPKEDVLGLRDEEAPGPHHRPMLEPVMRGGRRLARDPTIDEMRARFADDLAALPHKAKRLARPEHVIAHRTEALAALTAETTAATLRRVRSSD
jgi:nicotinate phosphoribosyltransferase